MNTLGNRLVQMGSYASLACAIQCALTPIVILALPFLTTNFSSEWSGILSSVLGETTEWLFLGMICSFGGFGLLTTYSIHQDKRPGYLSALGLLLLLLARLTTNHLSAGEITLDVLGASLIAWAGFWNRRLCHCLGCHTHEHATESSTHTFDQVIDPSSGK